MQQDAYMGQSQEHNITDYSQSMGQTSDIGEVKHGLDRVTVVTSIPIPRYSGHKEKAS